MPVILRQREAGKPIGEDQMRSICEDMLKRQRKSRHPVTERDYAVKDGCEKMLSSLFSVAMGRHVALQAQISMQGHVSDDMQC